MGVRSAWAAACRREAVKNIVMAVGEEVVESSGSLVERVCVFKGGLVGYFQGGRRREFRLLRVVGRKEGWREEEKV